MCLSSSLLYLVFEYLALVAFYSHGNFPSYPHFIQEKKKIQVYLCSPFNRSNNAETMLDICDFSKEG